MLDNVGIPTISALVKARKKLDELGAKQQLLIGGGINSGGDVAKALALGADGVFMATSLLVAMGCIYCRQCPLGKCPAGITTQDPKLRKKLNIDEAAQKVSNFINACTEEIKMVAGALGKKDIHQIKKENLRSTSLLMEKVTKIPLV
jgi:glutamate synthase domain-containing protein 2